MNLPEFYAAYLLTVLALSVHPGPTVTFVASLALAREWRGTALAIVGITLANVFGISLSAGIRALGLILPPEARLYLAPIGAALLLMLGTRLLRSSIRSRDMKSIAPQVNRSELRPFRLGWAMHSSNPNTIIFYTSVFMAGAPLGEGYARAVAAFGITAIAVDIIVLTCYSQVARGASQILPNRALVGFAPLLASLSLVCWGAIKLCLAVHAITTQPASSTP